MAEQSKPNMSYMLWQNPWDNNSHHSQLTFNDIKYIVFVYPWSEHLEIIPCVMTEDNITAEDAEDTRTKQLI